VSFLGTAKAVEVRSDEGVLGGLYQKNNMITLNNTLFDTKPFLFHMNGSHVKNSQGRKLRSELFKYIDSNIYEEEGGIRDTTYFICSSYGERETNLEKTLKFFKVPYVMSGRGTEGWVNTMKAGLLAEYLPKINTKYTMGIDAHDVLLLKDANGIIDTFEEEFDCDMLFNAELVSYPENEELADFEKAIYGDSPFHFLNSGVWIAKTEFLKTVIRDILEIRSSRPRSDQEIYRKLHKKYFPRIQIDNRCVIFQTTCESLSKNLRSSQVDPDNAYEVVIDKETSTSFNLLLKREKSISA